MYPLYYKLTWYQTKAIGILISHAVCAPYKLLKVKRKDGNYSWKASVNYSDEIVIRTGTFTAADLYRQEKLLEK